MTYTCNRFLIVLIITVLTSCNFADTNKKENLSLKTDFNLANYQNRYSILVPDYMNETDMLNEEASLQYQNIFKETYFALIEEPKQEFVDLFKQLDEYDDSLSVIDNYKNVQLEYFYDGLNVHNRFNDESRQINGLNTEIVKIDAEIDGVDIAYDIAYIEGDDNLYMLLFWTLETKRDRYSDTFNKSLNTFKVLNKRRAKKTLSKKKKASKK
jgi:hypothetical protein